jgi:hypothetical protein
MLNGRAGNCANSGRRSPLRRSTHILAQAPNSLAPCWACAMEGDAPVGVRINFDMTIARTVFAHSLTLNKRRCAETIKKLLTLIN